MDSARLVINANLRAVWQDQRISADIVGRVTGEVTPGAVTVHRPAIILVRLQTGGVISIDKFGGVGIVTQLADVGNTAHAVTVDAFNRRLGVPFRRGRRGMATFR